jgi:hypothetical protein
MQSKEKQPDESPRRLERIQKNPPSSTEIESGYVDNQPAIEWSDRDLAELTRKPAQ